MELPCHRTAWLRQTVPRACARMRLPWGPSHETAIAVDSNELHRYRRQGHSDGGLRSSPNLLAGITAPRDGHDMSVKEWSEEIILAELQDDPVFSEDLNQIQEMVESRAGGHVVLDLSGINFLNSSNIAKLLKLRKLVVASPGAKLRLCAINTSVWGVFLVTGLDKIFDFCDNVAGGLASVQIND